MASSPSTSAYQRPELADSSTSLRAGFSSVTPPLRVSSPAPSIADKFSLAPDPAEWGSGALTMTIPEPNDHLHNPDPKRDRHYDGGNELAPEL
ncbi:hypothetical protein BJY52DRAFT_1215140 [Lactarius psammicola]|nr:hypothetical protein BJY52DRAFT_1215140 [Lactarius psammicola]